MFGFMARTLLLVILTLKGANAQHSSVSCNVAGLDFSFNSLGQSPCLVTAYLAAPCSSDGDFEVGPLKRGHQYSPPDPPDKCLCSSVTFSLTNACAACQGALLTPWSLWIQNCTAQMKSPDGEYPLQIPLGTAVPAWAYQLVFDSNQFNVSLARRVGDSPEHTPDSPTSSSSSSLSSPSPSSSSSTQSTQTSSSSSASIPAQSTNATSSNLGGSRSSHAGPIAGGVIGGVVGIALIGGLFAFLLIRSNRNQYQQGKTFETPGTVAYPLNNGGHPKDRPMSNYSATTLPNSRTSIINPSSPSSGVGFPVALNTGRQGNQMNYLSGHHPQPSLQGTSINENPHSTNTKPGVAHDPDRLAVF